MRIQQPLSSCAARWLFVAALGVALLVRLYLLAEYYCISSDGIHYIETAKEYYAGRWWEGLGQYYSPGYPLLLAFSRLFVSDWELAGQLLSIACGVLLLWPLYLLFRDVYGARIALLACFLCALSPFLARYSVHVRSESPFFLLSTVSFWFVYRAIAKRRLIDFLSGGFIAGFAYLVRPESIGFLILVPCFLGLLWFSAKTFDWVWIGKAVGLLFVGFFVLALPYIIYLSIDTGKWGAISRKAGVTLGVSLRESGLLEGMDDEVQEEAKDFVKFVHNHPMVFVKKVAKDVFPSVGVFFEALHYSYVPFLLIGLWPLVRERFWQRKDFLLLAFVAFNVFGFALIYVKRRYALQAVPIALGWTALGMLLTWEYLSARFSARTAQICMAVLAVLFLAGTLPKTLTPISREKAYVRDAGWYFKKRDPTGNLQVAVFDDRISFYAGLVPLMLEEVKEADLRHYLSERNADYLAVEAKTLQRNYPTAAAQPAQYGLQLEKEIVGTRKDRLLIFKVS